MFDRYVGLPWRDRGRDFDGVDCWGLVWLANAGRGVALPSYAGRYATAADEADIRALIAGEIGAWRAVAVGVERPWDCVLMRRQHVGVVVEPGRVLHVAEGCSSVIDNYRAAPMRHRLLGFHRYAGDQ